MINTQFIRYLYRSLIVYNNSLNFIDNLTTALQSRPIDGYKANKDIQSVLKGIQVCRNNIDEAQLEWNEESSHLLSYSNKVISLSKLKKRQLHRANTPALLAEEYLKKVIYIPFLGHLIMEMK